MMGRRGAPAGCHSSYIMLYGMNTEVAKCVNSSKLQLASQTCTRPPLRMSLFSSLSTGLPNMYAPTSPHELVLLLQLLEAAEQLVL